MWRQIFAADLVRDRAVEALARQAAQLSVAAICRTVAGQTAGMTASETRGYIRARSGAEVRRQARLAIKRTPNADAAWLEPIMRRAAELAAPLAARQIAAGVGYITGAARNAA